MSLSDTCNPYIPNHPYAPEYGLVIYVAGPGTKDNHQTDLKFLNNNFNNVMVIGDGDQGLFDEDGQGVLSRNLNELSSDFPELLDQGKILIYTYIHGNVINGEHVLIAGDDGLAMYSKGFFKSLQIYINRPMDIIFYPCHGKAALNVANNLPDGSNVLIFSESDKSTLYNNIEHSIDLMPIYKEFTLNGFYDNYLNSLGLLNENPIMVNVGAGIIDPLQFSYDYIGSNISEASRVYVHNNLGQNICEESISCHERIDSVMDKMEIATSIDDFKLETQKYINLFSEFENEGNRYDFLIKNHHLTDVPYNYKNSEECYIEILDIKDKFDELLSFNEIPLELDLSHKNWHDDDEDDDEDEMFENYSEYFLYHTLIQVGFKENDNFAKPEPTDYGLALAISKDLHFSGLSLVDDFES